jgi:hypothetical protein
MTIIFLRNATLLATLLSATSAFAQNSGSAQSKALLIKPLTLTKLDDLDFGSIIPSGSGQTVTINADTGARTSTYPAGLVPTDPGRRARFASSGLNNTFVVLQLSPVADLTDGAGNTLQLTRLNLDAGGALRRLSPASQVFFVGIGGQVFVSANQAEGVYSGTFTLTADYL